MILCFARHRRVRTGVNMDLISHPLLDVAGNVLLGRSAPVSDCTWGRGTKGGKERRKKFGECKINRDYYCC